MKLKSTFNNCKLLFFWLIFSMLITAFAKAQPVISQRELIDSKLVIWTPISQKLPDGGKADASIAFPQVSVFDSSGKMIFHGSLLNSFKWMDSGAVEMAIPDQVQARNWKELAARVRLSEGKVASRFVVYAFDGCPPCVTQTAELRKRAPTHFKGAIEFQAVNTLIRQ
jgi:hypothetical protein